MEIQEQKPKKKKSKLKKVILIIIVVLIIGCFGISRKITLRAGDCEQIYRHYYIEPFVLNFLSCLHATPCGTNQWITTHNARIGIIKCLCENIEINKDSIVDYYNKELVVKDEASWQKESNDAEFICKERAQYMYRF